MNKKVLTFCAGFLLAGGMFSTLSAKSLAEVAGDGKYYKIAIAAASQSANTYVLDGGQDRMPGWWSNMNGVESDFDGSAWWTIEAVKDPVTGEPLAYRLKNAEGTYYTVTDADGKVYKDFYQTNSAATSSTSNYWMLKTYEGVGASGQFVLQNATTSTEANGWGINVLDLTPAAYNADFLNGILGNGFGLQICKQVIKADGSIDTDAAPVEYTDLVGNPFTGILVAKDAVGGGVELYQGSTTTGKKIVLTKDTWGTQGGGTTQEGYIFKAVTNAELTKLKDNNKFVTDVFTITLRLQ